MDRYFICGNPDCEEVVEWADPKDEWPTCTKCGWVTNPNDAEEVEKVRPEFLVFEAGQNCKMAKIILPTECDFTINEEKGFRASTLRAAAHKFLGTAKSVDDIQKREDRLFYLTIKAVLTGYGNVLNIVMFPEDEKETK